MDTYLRVTPSRSGPKKRIDFICWDADAERMRVLFVSVPGLGHVQPMLPLAKACQAAGHKVLWATGGESCGSVEQRGIPTVSVGLVGTGVPEYRRRYPEAASLKGEDIAAYMFPRIFGKIYAPPMAEELLGPAREWAPDLIVHDAATLAGPLVAAVLGIRHVTHSFGDAVPPQRLGEAAHEVAPLWEAAGLEAPMFAGNGQYLYINIFPASLQPELPDYIRRSQYLRPVALDAVPGDALPTSFPRLGSQPLIYLTLGTVFADPTVLRTAAEGIAALGVRLVVTVGPSGDPAAVGDLGRDVLVERYIPQALVLGHCAAVVSHGGSGTFLASLAQGLPQVFLPQAADQFRNAARCAEVGAGINLGPAKSDGERVGAAVARILAEDSFRRASRTLEAEVAAMPAPEEVVHLLEAAA